jgi:hypothetical protein
MLSQGRMGRVAETQSAAHHLSPSDLAILQPIVRIGVTGHRDLVDREQAGATASNALCHLLTVLETTKWPIGIMRSIAYSGTKVGYRIVSPLAEGADRVVAALALSPDPWLADRMRELVVPLPFQLDYYRGRDGQPGTDCGNPQSQFEFDRLRSAAQWVRPLHPYLPADSAQQKSWYRDVGTYVVEHCDFLFALWDGQDNKHEGGTADIVKIALKQGKPVIWVPVTRQGTTGPAVPIPQGGEPQLLTSLADKNGRLGPGAGLFSPQATAILRRWKASGSAAGLLLERFGRIEELCRYAQRSGRVPQAIAKEIRAAEAVPPAGAAAVQSVACWIVPAYVIADRLAKRYQWALKILNIGVYAAATAAVALGAFVAILFPYGGYWRLLAALEAIILVALFLVQALDIRKKCRDQWVTFRAMGEYFRTGRFLALVTPTAAGGLEFDRFARLHSWWSSKPASVPWFDPVIERAWERRPDLDLRDSDVSWLGPYLITQWIDGQIDYHRSRAKDHLAWDTIFRRAIRVILLATVFIVISHVILDYLPQHTGAHHTDRDLVSATLAFFAIALTSLAAAFNGYSGQQRHSYHSIRFQLMADELERIKESMRRAKTLGELRAHLRTARRTMLGETIDWYEEMEQQEIDSPS